MFSSYFLSRQQSASCVGLSHSTAVLPFGRPDRIPVMALRVHIPKTQDPMHVESAYISRTPQFGSKYTGQMETV